MVHESTVLPEINPSKVANLPLEMSQPNFNNPGSEKPHHITFPPPSLTINPSMEFLMLPILEIHENPYPTPLVKTNSPKKNEGIQLEEEFYKKREHFFWRQVTELTEGVHK